MHSLIDSIKKASLDAIEASKPVSVMFGTVISAAPLKINIEQKITLSSAQLILTNSVKDYEVEMTLDGSKNTYIIHNGLVVGDEVILLRVQGGQKFIVWGKII